MCRSACRELMGCRSVQRSDGWWIGRCGCMCHFTQACSQTRWETRWTTTLNQSLITYSCINSLFSQNRHFILVWTLDMSLWVLHFTQLQTHTTPFNSDKNRHILHNNTQTFCIHFWMVIREPISLLNPRNSWRVLWPILSCDHNKDLEDLWITLYSYFLFAMHVS